MIRYNSIAGTIKKAANSNNNINLCYVFVTLEVEK